MVWCRGRRIRFRRMRRTNDWWLTSSAKAVPFLDKRCTQVPKLHFKNQPQTLPRSK